MTYDRAAWIREAEAAQAAAEAAPTLPVKPGLTRPSWQSVRESYEYFDGEVEIEAATKIAWKRGRFDR